MPFDPPAPDSGERRRFRGLLVWGGLTLLAAVALALAMVIASLALELHSEPAPPPKPPIEWSPGGGHASPQ